MARYNDDPDPDIRFLDDNARFLNASCAGWLRGVLGAWPKLGKEAIRLAFWLAGDECGRIEALLDVMLTDSDRERLLPEIKSAWAEPEEMAGIVWMALGKATPVRRHRVSREVEEILEGWAALRSTLTEAPLARHHARVAAAFGLSAEEMELCYFLSAIKWHRGPQAFFDRYLDCDRGSSRNALLAALSWDMATMGRVTAGKLGRIGILERRGDLLSVEDDFAPFFVEPSAAPDTGDLCRMPARSPIASAELGIPEATLALVRRLLSSDTSAPCHVLIYGPPGTGKTTLARALIGELALEGIEAMGVQDNLSRSRRASLAVCLEMAAGNNRAVVLVDEADRLLNTSNPWHVAGEITDKGWLTRILDESPVRTVWIVNDHSGIDGAVRRRFSYSIEMPLPDRSVRARMFEAVLRRRAIKRHFADAHIEELAERFAVAPAVFDLAAATAARAGDSAADHRRALERALVAKLALDGRRPPMRPATEVSFLAQGVNPIGGLAPLLEMARAYDTRWSDDNPRLPALAMLFHGAPGTGKSETGRHIADILGRETVVRRASDILGMYVGQSEQNIAAAFAEASTKGAVLIIDEIDTFLRSRGGAERQWEASIVNEMLVQLEGHRGIVIATTNRLGDLDAAALRRFTAKTEFRPLSGEAVIEVYEAVLGPWARGKVSERDRQQLLRVEGLTTADMVVVRRNRVLLGAAKTPHAAMIAELEAEARFRTPAGAGPIGFSRRVAADGVGRVYRPSGG